MLEQLPAYIKDQQSNIRLNRILKNKNQKYSKYLEIK